ncbi:MAG: Hsp20/alpha crystallin family protein [Armatimonadetes bacterium]|nr:Hsp20/alpha crystallin family protein [Armatimonadota bacterium]
MSIVRYDPFRELDRLQSEINRMFEGVNAPTGERSAGSGAATPRWSPSVDVLETQTEIVLHVELPGMNPDDVDLEISGDTLSLRGERKFGNEERKNNFVRIERSYGRFQRQFTLTVPVNADAIKATYKDGVLEVHLPKSEANKPRKVQVTAAGANTPQAVEATTGDTGSVTPAPSESGASETTASTGEGSPS